MLLIPFGIITIVAAMRNNEQSLTCLIIEEEASNPAGAGRATNKEFNHRFCI